MALRHLRTGRNCIKPQYDVIEKLHLLGHPVDQAEDVLQWLQNTQRVFEKDCKRLLRAAEEKLRAAGYKDPLADWPRD